MDSALTFVLALSFLNLGSNSHVLFFGKRWFHYSLTMKLHPLGKRMNKRQVKLQICCDMSPRAILPRIKNLPFLLLGPKAKITAF